MLIAGYSSLATVGLEIGYHPSIVSHKYISSSHEKWGGVPPPERPEAAPTLVQYNSNTLIRLLMNLRDTVLDCRPHARASRVERSWFATSALDVSFAPQPSIENRREENTLSVVTA